jgi:hypothetical protein
VLRIRRGADPDLIVRLPDGLHVAIAMSWTDYALPARPVSVSNSTHLLDFQGLLQVAQFIEYIRQQGVHCSLPIDENTSGSSEE